VASAGDGPAALLALAAILVAGYLGGTVQFLLVRGALRRALISLLTRFGVPKARIDALAERLRRTGARGVAIARVTPGVRVPAIAASGLAALPLPAFLVGLVIGNGVFVAAHFALGFVVGAPAAALVQSAGPALVIGGLVVLSVFGAIGWLLLQRRNRESQNRFAAWADAACPACLALTALGAESITYTSDQPPVWRER
jgi:membrane protein DedA with SNARE-associated domain